MRKAKTKNVVDNRSIAIYARKSKITHKGDSTAIQTKQSAEFACSQLSLPADYEFLQYEDKGLSGYYTDRPDFQRMLRDIEQGKIRAVVCYKLDRISRKTSDLLRLVEYLNKYDVSLLVCSNNINTAISTSKIMISFLAIIAEFERDIIAERIADNLMELSKDGRWMGGCTPTGFSVKRLSKGSGKNKVSISHLETIEEEKLMVVEIFNMFIKCRSINGTTTYIQEKYKTKTGKEHTSLSVRNILKNPIYCTADEEAYNYFYNSDGNICCDKSEFDGVRGISVYNKTDQEKVEDEISTFLEPRFVQVHTEKAMEEWIVSVGKHEGFVESKIWIEAQYLITQIKDKYNRPHRVTNALLSGKIYCPICGSRLNVFPESGRFTEGKPRFKYGCPNQRKSRSANCNLKPVNGNLLDDFFLEKLSELANEASVYYIKNLDSRLGHLLQSNSSERELVVAKDKLEKLRADIATQVRNMREADANIRSFIQEDIVALSSELSNTEEIVLRLENAKKSKREATQGLEEIKTVIFDFATFIKNIQYEEQVGLISSVIERIIIKDYGNEQICHIFIKGATKVDYSDFFDGGYLSEEFLTDTHSNLCNREEYRKCDTFSSGFATTTRLRRGHEKARSCGGNGKC